MGLLSRLSVAAEPRYGKPEINGMVSLRTGVIIEAGDSIRRSAGLNIHNANAHHPATSFDVSRSEAALPKTLSAARKSDGLNAIRQRMVGNQAGGFI
jgi:hypothetical protein